MALPKPQFTEADVHAIRALLRGEATADQQRRAMRVILEDVCHIYDSPYVADGSDRESFVMMGRHQVGVIVTSAQTARVLEEARAHDYALAHPETTRVVPELTARSPRVHTRKPRGKS